MALKIVYEDDKKITTYSVDLAKGKKLLQDMESKVESAVNKVSDFFGGTVKKETLTKEQK
jgi:hypothetical protein